MEKISFEEFKALYLTQKVKDVAIRLGVSESRICHLAKKFGITRFPGNTKRKLKVEKE